MSCVQLFTDQHLCCGRDTCTVSCVQFFTDQRLCCGRDTCTVSCVQFFTDDVCAVVGTPVLWAVFSSLLMTFVLW